MDSLAANGDRYYAKKGSFVRISSVCTALMLKEADIGVSRNILHIELGPFNRCGLREGLVCHLG